MGAFGSSVTWTLGRKGPKYPIEICSVPHNFFRRTLVVAATVGKVRSFLKALYWKRERKMLKKPEGRDFWGP